MRGSYLNDPCRGGEDPPDEMDLEIEAREEMENAVSQAAGTCCIDPTPAQEPGDGPDEGRTLYYCEACGAETGAAAYAALVVNLPEVRARITRLRAAYETGGPDALARA